MCDEEDLRTQGQGGSVQIAKDGGLGLIDLAEAEILLVVREVDAKVVPVTQGVEPDKDGRDLNSRLRRGIGPPRQGGTGEGRKGHREEQGDPFHAPIIVSSGATGNALAYGRLNSRLAPQPIRAASNTVSTP